MNMIYAVSGIVVFVAAAGIIGYLVADRLDKKYGTDHP